MVRLAPPPASLATASTCVRDVRASAIAAVTPAAKPLDASRDCRFVTVRHRRRRSARDSRGSPPRSQNLSLSQPPARSSIAIAGNDEMLKRVQQGLVHTRSRRESLLTQPVLSQPQAIIPRVVPGGGSDRRSCSAVPPDKLLDRSLKLSLGLIHADAGPFGQNDSAIQRPESTETQLSRVVADRFNRVVENFPGIGPTARSDQSACRINRRQPGWSAIRLCTQAAGCNTGIVPDARAIRANGTSCVPVRVKWMQRSIVPPNRGRHSGRSAVRRRPDGRATLQQRTECPADWSAPASARCIATIGAKTACWSSVETIVKSESSGTLCKLQRVATRRQTFRHRRGPVFPSLQRQVGLILGKRNTQDDSLIIAAPDDGAHGLQSALIHRSNQRWPT